MTLALIPLLACTTSSDSSTCSNSNRSGSTFVPRNIWAWRSTKDIINDSEKRSEFITFAETHNIRTVYVSVRTMLERYGTASPETNTETNLPTFIDLAAKKCIDVQLLIGNSGSYVSTAQSASNYPTMSTLTTNAKNYVSSLSGTKPTAIHWDVEPHALADWDANKQLYLQRLVNAFQVTRSILAGSGLKQAADIPHWWDSSATYGSTSCDANNNTTTPTYTNQVGYQCLVRIMDQIDIMDYRDDATLSVSQALVEINFAGSNLNFNGLTTPIMVGQALNINTDLTLTFYDEITSTALGTRIMEVQLQSIQNSLNDLIGYGGYKLQNSYQINSPTQSNYSFPSDKTAGISLHHYEAYSDAAVTSNFP